MKWGCIILFIRFSKFPRQNGKSLYKGALKGFGSCKLPLTPPSYILAGFAKEFYEGVAGVRVSSYVAA